MQHRIRKQVMDLSIDSRLDAFRTQHLAGPFYYRQILPVLEKIFDELSSGDEIIQLDKLELDLGVMVVHDLESTQWSSELEKMLRIQVITAMQERPRDANLVRRAQAENICRQWLFYMQHGFLPWNSKAFDEKDLTAILEMLATDFALVQALRKLIAAGRPARVRIIRNHKTAFLVSLMEILTAASQRDLVPAIKEATQFLQVLHKKTETAETVSIQALQQIWTKVLEIAAASTHTETTKLVEALLLEESKFAAIPADHEQQLTTLTIIFPIWKELVQKNALSPGQNQNETEEAKKIRRENKPEGDSKQPTEIDEHGIFLSHAGLVLIHPFLATFFNRLELVENNEFKDPAATDKALYLLHYLATGQVEAEEHKLAIPKLLCDLPLDYAPETIIGLSDEEKEEADNLLDVAIERWDKLKNSSIDALRENFLQREGKLYTKNDIRYLQLETGSLDVLLDYLPWTLSIVKLPWMKEMLRIEWR